MIDIWLIFAQTVPFIQVLLFTMKDVIDAELNKLKDERTGKSGREKLLNWSEI